MQKRQIIFLSDPGDTKCQTRNCVYNKIGICSEILTNELGRKKLNIRKENKPGDHTQKNLIQIRIQEKRFN